MNKRGRDRNRILKLAATAVVATLAVVGWTVVALAKSPPVVALKYGDLIRLLKLAETSPDVQFRRLQLSHTDIRGEIVTADRVSVPDGETTRHTQTTHFRTQRTGFENDQSLYASLKGGATGYQGAEEDGPLKAVGGVLTSLIILVGSALALIVAFRWMSGNNSPFTFGRSRAKLASEDEMVATFADVAGIDEAVGELREVVDFLSRPDRYKSLGGRIPKGVLLVGPPGTGKTLLARAVAGEAGVAFFSLSGSDFVEMFVGVGAARVRDLFGQAEAKAPCIIFIDELDALGKTRGGPSGGGHDEREQTLNALLVEMDGFDANTGVILMAATNRPETLDPALLRPGRFDRTVVVDRPDISGREAILRVHVRDVKLGADVDLRRVAGLTPGTAGADLANLVNEAALMAGRSGKEEVTMTDFDEAIERGAVGLERKSRIMNAAEKQRVAYHEAGHALVAVLLPNTHPVHKISIIPRGVGALGYVLSRPDEDRYLVTQTELESRIMVALGGTVAEEIVFGEISNGATSDLEQSSDIARRMVTQFGMSRLGRVSYQENDGPGFLGASDGDRRYSPQTAREIDLEVRLLIENATNKVRGLLDDRRATLEAVAARLIEKEVMDGRELRRLLEETPTAERTRAG